MEVTKEYLEKKVAEYKEKAEQLKQSTNIFTGAWQALEQILQEMKEK